MKNTLLFAGLVSISGFLCAQSNHNQELLMHLKNTRKGIVERIEEAEVCESHLSSSAEKELYNFQLKLLRYFYNESESLKKIIMDDIAWPELEIICNNIEPWDAIVAKIADFKHEEMQKLLCKQNPDQSVVPVCGCGMQYPMEISTQLKKEFFEIFRSVFLKLYQEQIENNIFTEATIDEYIEYLFEPSLSELLWLPELLGKEYPLLQLLDEKIGELEAQV